IILLADTAIKVNDVIEVNGLVCQVLHINLRTTTVITRDDKYSLVLKDPAPTVRFSNFGDSSLDFTLLFWADEIFRVEKTKSELRIKIYELFQQNNVTIPFPQRVIHSAHK
ncbi:MAG: mechanosensitive ion channel domain-containing protein, partial [Bacteroidales bacterium]